jgi:amidase
VIEAQRASFEALGCVVEDACPDFADADEIFLPIRAFRSATLLGGLLEKHASIMKPEAIWEIEFGLRLTSVDLARALTRHALLLERVRRFQETHPFLVCATSQVPPFDASLDWPREIDGVEMEHYIAWMKSAYWITLTLRPAISVPAGLTEDGMPVGVQIVGSYRDDLGVLQLAHAFEAATGVGRRRQPALPEPCV